MQGGERKNAGRKKLPPDQKLNKYSFQITRGQYAWLSEMGDGNHALGFRLVLEGATGGIAHSAGCKYTKTAEDCYATECGREYYLYTEWGLAQEMEFGAVHCPFCGGRIKE